MTCPNCRNHTFYHYITSTRWFRLYFIPVLPLGAKHFLLCPVCTRGKELVGAQRDHVKRMQQLTSSWRAGKLTDEQYRANLDAFWQAMGAQLGTAAPPLPGSQQGQVAPASPGSGQAPPPPLPPPPGS